MSHMLEQIGGKEERHAAKARQSWVPTKEIVEHANVAKSENNKHNKELQEKSYDWTRTYKRWDAWEDPEELARQELEARERSVRATKTQMSCNHDHSAEKKVMDMTTYEKLSACGEFRVLGNLFFQHGQYQRAAYHYNKALVYFEYMFPDTDAEEAQADALKLKMLLNFTACRLKTMHLDDAIRHATQALEIDQESVKTLYRRAQAYRLKDEFELAQNDIDHAIKLSTSTETTQSVHATLLQELKLLQAKKLAYKLRTKQLSASMFGTADKAKNPEKNEIVSSSQRAFEQNPMTLHLISNLSASMPSMDTWQPCIRGLKELQALNKM
ncbi:hypothetical protein CCR75_007012 [Bremia lactucae]|uniref:Uncharacterized protein n=1 Tax=Bremia lactucae TaxID=4779 RepID=A0A976FGQ9_BRELC|nr:hypothetical protein CCR75_007012 [Bremia lactucae]